MYPYIRLLKQSKNLLGDGLLGAEVTLNTPLTPYIPFRMLNVTAFWLEC